MFGRFGRFDMFDMFGMAGGERFVDEPFTMIGRCETGVPAGSALLGDGVLCASGQEVLGLTPWMCRALALS